MVEGEEELTKKEKELVKEEKEIQKKKKKPKGSSPDNHPNHNG